ncbi:periplasmic heavy metal sensor [Roseomonas sp. GC11]|uniref:periplasmic heavy metal sensor n=1 Tax=Roseomonas sp. GC11 TaxID=2950546 RepID=UPI00210C2F68|nr:periplasmic heavy metal sensor [Roseomonas sp. GC11]MCQ4161285.1 periplasmic heavy metal sensor [Roseomonas sp. GC11]
MSWLKAGLGASLALNLVLGGVLLLRPDKPQRRPDFFAMQAQMATVLPEAERARFLAVLEGVRTRVQEALARHDAARAATEASLAEEPFDPARMRAATLRARQEWNGISSTVEDSLIDAVTTLSPEGRQRLAEEMRQRRATRRKSP